ncbi:hypothetical protein PCAR4_40131 [Paraburkholderia caribensis]|nr:hypothetical protein PCAR4_40131 [Paraburkholderia caribensis]
MKRLNGHATQKVARVSDFFSETGRLGRAGVGSCGLWFR